MPKFSFPGRIPSFNLVAISYSNKNFPANKNINNNNKNFGNNNKNINNINKNFGNNKNLKNISQINYPNLKGRVKFPSIIKFSIKFGNTKFPYYIEIKFLIIINFKFPYYIVINIKINNVIGVRQLQEAKPERNCLTNHQHCLCQDGTQKFLSLRIKFQG